LNTNQGLVGGTKERFTSYIRVKALAGFFMIFDYWEKAFSKD